MDMGRTLNLWSGLELGESVDVMVWQGGVQKKRRGMGNARGVGDFVTNWRRGQGGGA